MNALVEVLGDGEVRFGLLLAFLAVAGWLRHRQLERVPVAETEVYADCAVCGDDEHGNCPGCGSR